MAAKTPKKPAAKPAAKKPTPPAKPSKPKPAAPAPKPAPRRKPHAENPGAKKPAAKKPAKVKAEAAPVPDAPPAEPRKPAPVRIQWDSDEMIAVYDRETAAGSFERATDVSAKKVIWDDLREACLAAKKDYEKGRTDLQKWDLERRHGRGKPPANTGNLFAGAEMSEREKELERKYAEMMKENDRLRMENLGNGKERAKVEQLTAEIAANTAMPTDAPKAGNNIDPVHTPTPAAAEPAKNWYPDDLFRKVPIEKFKDFGLSPKNLVAMKAGDMKEGRSAYPMPTLGDVADYTKPMSGGFTRRLTDLKGFGGASQTQWEAAHEGFWNWWGNKGAEEFARQCGYTEPAPVPAAAADVVPPAAPPIDDGKRGGGAKDQGPVKKKRGKKNAEQPAAGRAEGGASATVAGGEPASPGAGNVGGYDPSVPAIPALESIPDLEANDGYVPLTGADLKAEADSLFGEKAIDPLSDVDDQHEGPEPEPDGDGEEE